MDCNQDGDLIEYNLPESLSRVAWHTSSLWASLVYIRQNKKTYKEYLSRSEVDTDWVRILSMKKDIVLSMIKVVLDKGEGTSNEKELAGVPSLNMASADDKGVDTHDEG